MGFLTCGVELVNKMNPLKIADCQLPIRALKAAPGFEGKSRTYNDSER